MEDGLVLLVLLRPVALALPAVPMALVLLLTVVLDTAEPREDVAAVVDAIKLVEDAAALLLEDAVALLVDNRSVALEVERDTEDVEEARVDKMA